MSSHDLFSSDAGRGLEILCGIVLLGFVFVIGFIALEIGNALPWRLSGIAIISALLLLGWGLLRVSWRLLSHTERPSGGLLSPSAIIVGATIFGVGGIGLILLGIEQRSLAAVASGIATFPMAYYAWRLAQKRKEKGDA